MSIGNNAVGIRTIRNGCTCLRCKFRLKRKVSDGHTRVNRTYVEDLKNSGEVQSPGGNRLFVVLREESRDRISFPPLDDFPLDLRHSPAIQGMMSRVQDASVSLTPSIVQSPQGCTDGTHSILSPSSPGRGPCRHQRKLARCRRSPPR